MFRDTAPSLAGHKGLRADILSELKKTQPQGAKELAERFSVTSNAVRRHLKELEADGFVAFVRERQRHGAPAFRYRLTEAGEGLFPRRYAEALTSFLSVVEREHGRDEVGRLFADGFRTQAQDLRRQLDGADLPTRAQALVDLLTKQGFMAEWSVESGALTIAEHNCAVHAVARQFPEICRAEEEFLREVLGVDIVRRSHIPAGCNACEYAVAVKSEER
jgi:DeoR family suf operon transcriptional repressor